MIAGWRSLLFVSAADQVRLAKVADRAADAVILDLEDAVPPDRKAAARDGVPAAAAAIASRGSPVIVRINAEWRAACVELPLATRPDIAAIMVPKAESGARLSVIAEMVREYAGDAGMDAPPGLIALVESPAGVAALDEIAVVPGMIGLALGTEDFSLALGVPPSREALELPCRLLALAAARHGLMALGLPVSIATIDDMDAWQEGIRMARAVGMTGALCIHPRQIAPVNQGFALSVDEVDRARRVLDAWDAAGRSGVVLHEGRMIDRPVVLAAERTLRRTDS